VADRNEAMEPSQTQDKLQWHSPALESYDAGEAEAGGGPLPDGIMEQGMREPS